MPLFGPPNVTKLEARRDITGLLKALGYKKDADVRKAAARALGHIGDAQAVESLIAALKEWDRDVRKVAVERIQLIWVNRIELGIEQEVRKIASQNHC